MCNEWQISLEHIPQQSNLPLPSISSTVVSLTTVVSICHSVHHWANSRTSLWNALPSLLTNSKFDHCFLQKQNKLISWFPDSTKLCYIFSMSKCKCIFFWIKYIWPKIYVIFCVSTDLNCLFFLHTDQNFFSDFIFIELFAISPFPTKMWQFKSFDNYVVRFNGKNWLNFLSIDFLSWVDFTYIWEAKDLYLIKMAD